MNFIRCGLRFENGKIYLFDLERLEDVIDSGEFK
jgi:hypothetical protein